MLQPLFYTAYEVVLLGGEHSVYSTIRQCVSQYKPSLLKIWRKELLKISIT